MEKESYDVIVKGMEEKIECLETGMNHSLDCFFMAMRNLCDLRDDLLKEKKALEDLKASVEQENEEEDDG